MVDDCCGCHTAPSGTQNNGTGNIPYVDQTDPPTYGATGTTGNTLAGGTFYFMRNGGVDAKGHNVACLMTQDGDLGLDPPGYDSTLGSSLGLPAGAWTDQLTCAGAFGCHGDHNATDPFGAVRGGHHGDDTPPLDGSSVPKSYRFLVGIKGLECNTASHKWEYQPTSAIHNQYKGKHRTTDDYEATDTINYLCAECHGFFHSATNAADLAEGGTAATAAFASPWARHPTDFDMTHASTGEYANYNGAGHNYNPIAPLASETVTSVISTITFGGTDAIVEGVKSAGVPEKNIIIWDRANRDLEKAGYRIQTNRNKLKIYGNDQVGYSRRLYEFGEAGSFLSNILVEQCTAIVNVPILKDHGIVGMTNALKNFFGAIHNPNKYHDFFGDPYIADVNMFSEIRKKTRLTVTDALTAQYEGGPPFMPQWAWNFNGIIVGMDRVAMDAYAWKLIDEKRKEKGLPTLKEAGREPIYIRTAADENHRLGTDDLSKIELIQV
ncbi:hypothetical protein B6D60_08265 [candidate division KSB1 bacterium 4484_87]|nr:MAG: hypothetical protein B6D60_08265 [candidate division KSB1 bacterium 4484_87]